MRGADILHVDLDAFYASVEQMLNPELRGKPIGVGGGVILASSYEAKRFGVSSGMNARQARALCPGLIIVDGHFSEYQRLADEVFEICEQFTPNVERISIDEAFLDVAGSRHLFGAPGVLGESLRARVAESVGLPISVGVARTKFLAKVASQVAKPDGLIHVAPTDELSFLHPLPVRLMWGVGPVTEQRLADAGIATIGELAMTPERTLSGMLGKGSGRHLHVLAWNQDPRPVAGRPRAKSVGAQSAFPRTTPTPDLVNEVLGSLTDRVGRRLRAKDRSGRTVTVRMRFAGMERITRSHTTSQPISSTAAILRIARHLAWSGLDDYDPLPQVTLLGIAVSNLKVGTSLQLELDLDGGDVVRPGSDEGRRRWQLDRSVDSIRDRFGSQIVAPARSLARTTRSVPDGFRELAERD